MTNVNVSEFPIIIPALLLLAFASVVVREAMRIIKAFRNPDFSMKEKLSSLGTPMLIFVALLGILELLVKGAE